MQSNDGMIIRMRSRHPGLRVLIAMAMLLSARSAPVLAEGTTVLQGQVIDVDNRPVEGARVFAYDDADVRRPANFITNPTDVQGSFRMILTPGKYWIVARLKKGEEYGPLMPGDKHSGEPVVLDIASGREMSVNFTVADLKDARKMHSRDRERPVRISGRIIDGKGSPVPNAYAIAHRSGSIEGVPDHVSAGADAEGRYTIVVPRGRYFIGSAVTFPPGKNYVLQGELSADADRAGMDIIMKTPNRK